MGGRIYIHTHCNECFVPNATFPHDLTYHSPSHAMKMQGRHRWSFLRGEGGNNKGTIPSSASQIPHACISYGERLTSEEHRANESDPSEQFRGSGKSRDPLATFHTATVGWLESKRMGGWKCVGYEYEGRKYCDPDIPGKQWRSLWLWSSRIDK